MVDGELEELQGRPFLSLQQRESYDEPITAGLDPIDCPYISLAEAAESEALAFYCQTSMTISCVFDLESLLPSAFFLHRFVQLFDSCSRDRPRSSLRVCHWYRTSGDLSPLHCSLP